MKKTTLDFAPKWAAPVLLVAGFYNIVWGTSVVLLPNLFFQIAGMDLPRYPELWQCIGMIVGVYGVGYIAAATDPLKYWPIVLVGLLGKIFGPIGFAKAVIDGVFPPSFSLVILFNDLVWWVPLGLLLWKTWDVAYHDRVAKANGDRAMPVKKALARFQTSKGKSLLDHSREQPILLVFLRHGGCTFCREAMAEIQQKRKSIESSSGTLPILVDMMSDDEESREVYAKYDLDDLPRVHDMRRILYRSMKLKRGGLLQLFGPKTWINGFRAGVLEGHGVGSLKGDGLQMPGVFLISDGTIVRSYRHKSAADRPNYESMACSIS